MPATWKQRPFKTPPAKNVVQGYLDAFDPDVLVQFAQTIPSYVKDTGLRIVRPEEIWRPQERQDLSPEFGLGIFELLYGIYDEYFKYKAKYPAKIVFPKVPEMLSLFWASLFGEIPPDLMPLIQKHYFEAVEAESVDFQPDRLLELMNARTLFPRRITQFGTAPQRRTGGRGNACIYFMDGSKVEDVVDYWNLRAIGKQVLPVPKQLIDHPQLHEIAIDFLKAWRVPWPHNPKVCDSASIIRARNCTMAEVQNFAKTLNIQRKPEDPSDSPFFVLQHWYPRVWDEWARDKDGAVPADIYGAEETTITLNDTTELKFTFSPLLPKFANARNYHAEIRCANEISFRFYGSGERPAQVFPKSPGQNYQRVISGFAFNEWRVGRNGLVKLVRDGFSETRELPSAEELMFAWLADFGWRPKLSSPGLLAKEIHRKLGGHPLPLLLREKLLGLLEHMNGGLVKRDGSPVEEEKIGPERHLSVGEVKSRVSDPGIYKYLLSKGVFTLGLRVQCPNCFRASWRALGEAGNAITCPRCLETFPAIGNLENSDWCYKTSGPFSVPRYADGAYSVILTMEFFNEHRLPTLRTTSIPSFVAEGSGDLRLEVDVALFWKESLFGEEVEGVAFAECKTYAQFEEKDFQRMRVLAKTFPGAVLVFSTLRKRLNKKEISKIAAIARSGRKHWKAERPINPVLVLTGAELLNHTGPPYCWEDSVHKKFDRLRGLLNICDATQQIHLGLQSRHTAWHEQAQKRIQRRLAKQNSTSTPI